MLAKLRPRSVYDVMAALALFLVVAGGTAYAADTIFSSDIVNGEVKEVDIGTAAVREDEIGQAAVTASELKNDAVTSAKVLNETLVGADVKDNALKGADIDESTLSGIGGGLAGGDLTGSYPNPTIASNAVGSAEVADETLTKTDIGAEAVGASELEFTGLYNNERLTLNDDVGGAPTQSELIALSGGSAYRMVAECSEPTAGTIQARVLVQQVAGPAETLAVDSTAPNGTVDLTGVDPSVTPVPLIGLGPTTGSHWDSGSYSLQAFVSSNGIFVDAFSGIVAAGTKIGTKDCAFAVTGVG
jgi:hypothetical protein